MEKEKGTIMGKIFFRKSPFATPCGRKDCKENATTLLNINNFKTYACIAVCESCLKKYDIQRSEPVKEKPIKKPIMKTQGDHIKVICGVCDDVIKQCRCMDCNKTVSTGICDKHELTEEAKSNIIESMVELTQSGKFGGIIGDAEETITKKFKDTTNGMELTDTVTITVEDFNDGIREVEHDVKMNNLLTIHKDLKYGGMDFRIKGTVQELSYEQMKQFREMIVVAIGEAERMWKNNKLYSSKGGHPSEQNQVITVGKKL